mgnify:CR=1 FL=1
MQHLIVTAMRRSLAVICALTLLAQPVVSSADDGVAAAEVQAIAVMEAFLETFNARDEAAWADTLVFPHLRMASGTVVVYQNREEFLAAMDLDAFAANTGWRRSTWDDMAVIQSSAQKVHIRVRFSRFDANDELIASYDSLYIIEPVDGRWGVRARSSFAP